MLLTRKKVLRVPKVLGVPIVTISCKNNFEYKQIKHSKP